MGGHHGVFEQSGLVCVECGKTSFFPDLTDALRLAANRTKYAT